MESVLQSVKFLMPKSDCTVAECEDAVAVNDSLGRYAIADGATEAFDAGKWAKKLTEAWVAAERDTVFGEEFREARADASFATANHQARKRSGGKALASVIKQFGGRVKGSGVSSVLEPSRMEASGNARAEFREKFKEWVSPLGKDLQISWAGQRLTWYREEKARSGSFAAFVGLEIRELQNAWLWRAVSLGDSCLVHLKNDGGYKSWPIEDQRTFNSSPVLVPSLPDTQMSAFDCANILYGNLERGETLLLLSDAVAAWFIGRAEAKDPIRLCFESLWTSEKTAHLEEIFTGERTRGRLKDDDIAIAAIRVTADNGQTAG